MAAIVWTKGPDEVLDFKLNWATSLEEGEAVVTSEWTLEDGITSPLDSIANDGTVAVIWLSSGTNGTTYTLVNSVVTDSTPLARTMDQTVLVVVGNN